MQRRIKRKVVYSSKSHWVDEEGDEREEKDFTFFLSPFPFFPFTQGQGK